MSTRRYVFLLALISLPLALAFTFCAADLVAKVREAGARQGLEMAALECAQTGEGTDSAIVECYTSRGLTTPDGL